MSQNQPWLSPRPPADQVRTSQFRAGPHSQGPPCHQVTILTAAPSTPFSQLTLRSGWGYGPEVGTSGLGVLCPACPLMPSLWPAGVASKRTASLPSLPFLCSVFPSHACFPVRDLSSAQHCRPGSGSMSTPLFHIPLLTLLSFAVHLDLYFHRQCLFSSVFFSSLSHYPLSLPSWTFSVAAFVAIFPFYLLNQPPHQLSMPFFLSVLLATSPPLFPLHPPSDLLRASIPFCPCRTLALMLSIPHLASSQFPSGSLGVAISAPSRLSHHLWPWQPLPLCLCVFVPSSPQKSRLCPPSTPRLRPRSSCPFPSF